MKLRNVVFALTITFLLIGGSFYISYKKSRALANLSLSTVPANTTDDTFQQQIILGNNKTNELSSAIVGNYIYSRAQYGSLDTSLSRGIGQQALENILDQGGAPEIFYVKNLNTFPDGDTEKLKIFAKTFADIQTKYENRYEADSIPQLDAAYIQTLNGQNQLRRTSALYSSLATELQNLSVPASQESNYVSLLQVYLNYSKNLLLISNIDSDPTGAMLGLMRQMDIWDEDLVIVQRLASYLKERGII